MRFRIVGPVLVLLAGGGCGGTPCAEVEPYSPYGYVVEEGVTRCDCEGVLFVCHPSVCTGEPGATYCEPSNFYGGFMEWECRDCDLEIDNRGVISHSCP